MHPEMSLCFHKTTQCYIPESCHLHTHHHENPKFDKVFVSFVHSHVTSGVDDIALPTCRKFCCVCCT
jgi:hypothetical protein